MQYLHEKLTYKIHGACFAVYNKLGPGFSEKIYQRAICRELDKVGVPYETESSSSVLYGTESLGEQRLDLVVDGKIVVEIKATEHHPSLFDRQTISYLKGTQLELGMLVNCGGPKLIIKRFINQRSHDTSA